ncbi:MAG: hypothetical protein U1E05_18725 [Patescibacteria group bacterium]|nr:hypothetical protein [Patescibacteria group bacterium]
MNTSRSQPKVASPLLQQFTARLAEGTGVLPAVRGVCLVLFVLLGGCYRNSPTTFSPSHVEIVAQGIPDAEHIELHFRVDNKPGWHCPGVNVSRRDETRIDVWFLMARDNPTGATECDVFAIENKVKRELTVRIPHNWMKHKEAEVFVDGSKSLGRWSFEDGGNPNKRSLGLQKPPVKTQAK